MVDLATGLGMSVEQLIQAGENILFPILSIILGGAQEMLFERVLFLAIVGAIVYVVVSKMNIFEGNSTIIWIITGSVSLLATRFLAGEELVKTVILPYSVLGIVISAALPLLIYFFFVQSFETSSTVRRLLWIFYVVVFIGIWGNRYDEVGELAWIYFLSAGAGFFFLLFDGTIRRAIVRHEIDALGMQNRDNFLRKLREQLGDLNNDLTKGYITQKEYDRLKKRIGKQMKAIQKN